MAVSGDRLARPALDLDARAGFDFVRAGVLLAIGALLVWLVLTLSFAAYFADVDPNKALALNSRQSSALLNLADKSLQAIAAEQEKRTAIAGPAGGAADRVSAFSNMAKAAAGTAVPEDATQAPPVAAAPAPAGSTKPVPPPQFQQVRLWAEQALRQDPLNARAMRMLGVVADSEHDKDKAARYMRTAARWSLRETYAVYWMLGRSFEKKDLANTVTYADIALRTRSKMAPHIIPFLARIAETPDGNREIKRMLGAHPPWRTQFLLGLPKWAADPRMPLDMMLAIKDTPNPPTQVEIAGYLNSLIARNLYDLAYYTWLQFLPPEQLGTLGLLFNGSFEIPATDLPFDWSLPASSGVTIQVVPKPGQLSERALKIQFGQGRAELGGLRQLVLLPQGNYKFEGSQKGELAGRRGLVWRITCADSSAAIGSSPLFSGKVPDWTKFEFAFSVPPSCRAQYVQLVLDARSESEKLLTGTAWYDELRIARIQETAKP